MGLSWEHETNVGLSEKGAIVGLREQGTNVHLREHVASVSLSEQGANVGLGSREQWALIYGNREQM